MTPADELPALYDREMRKDPVQYPGTRIERPGAVVRVVGSENFVIYSDLDDESAPPVVAREAEFFRRRGAEVEWKTFGHDRPKNLPEILAGAGFVPDEPETIVVFDLADGIPGGSRPADVEVRRVTDSTGAEDALRASQAAFGPDGRPFVDRWEEWARDPHYGLFVAYVDGRPVASGRVELPDGKSFAGLYGGGTAPEHRGRGIYRSLVAERAALARSRGYRFLTVDARETSRPILERLGFVPLTTTRGWVLRPDSVSAPDAPNGSR
jgi:GNAT superfamily N-acetyltransferase